METQKIKNKKGNEVLEAYNRLADAINFELLRLDTKKEILCLIGFLRTKLDMTSKKFGGK